MMPQCCWGNCKKTAEKPVHISLPNSKDGWWKKGQTNYLCEKHYKKLKKLLGIREEEGDL